MTNQDFHNNLYLKLQNEDSFNFSDFDIKNIGFEEIKETDTKMIKFSKLYYKNEDGLKTNLNFKTPQISHEVPFYNIPNITEFAKTDKDRSYLQFCFAHDRAAESSIDYKSIELFMNFINDIDNYFASDEVKKILFGANANQYEYKSSIKIEEEDRFDKVGKQIYLPPALKLRIDLDKNNYPLCILLVNNNGKYNLIKHTKLEDIKANIKYKSKMRFNINLNKIFITKSKPKKYWPIYKIRAILIDEIPVYKPKVQYALFDNLNESSLEVEVENDSGGDKNDNDGNDGSEIETLSVDNL